VTTFRKSIARAGLYAALLSRFTSTHHVSSSPGSNSLPESPLAFNRRLEWPTDGSTFNRPQRRSTAIWLAARAIGILRSFMPRISGIRSMPTRTGNTEVELLEVLEQSVRPVAGHGQKVQKLKGGMQHSALFELASDSVTVQTDLVC
jgi:hypothetical protein